MQKPSCSEGNSFRALKTNSGQQTADHEVPLLLPVEMNGNGSPNQQPLFDMLQNHVNRYSERSNSITFAHDRLCDPLFWSPLIYYFSFLCKKCSFSASWRSLRSWGDVDGDRGKFGARRPKVNNLINDPDKSNWLANHMCIHCKPRRSRSVVPGA